MMMMNRLIAPSVVLVALAAGCAGPTSCWQRSQRVAPGQQPQEQVEFSAADVEKASARLAPAASALVFDLPVAYDVPTFNLDRESRQPAAFVGFEGPSVEYHTVLINNSQSVGVGFGCGLDGSLGDGYQRQDTIQRTSVRYR
jgi:hypothetical protein